MKTSTRLIISSALLASLFNLAAADSNSFTLVLDASGTSLDGNYLWLDSDSKFYISTSENPITATILSNTSLSINDHAVGIGRNYLSTVAQSAFWKVAEPFTVEDGYLKLFGSDFHAVPDGEDDGKYVLGSINAAAGRSDMIVVKIKADGYSDSSDASSTEASTSTGATSTEASSTEAGATTSSTEASTGASTGASTDASTGSTISTKATSGSGSSAVETSTEVSNSSKSNLSSSTSSSPSVVTYDNGAAKIGGGLAGIFIAGLALI